MKETSFIKQNKEKWHKFEQMYHQNKKDPDELSSLFVELTDDLSYARTHYPKRTVRVYLNGLAQKVYNQLYRKKSRYYPDNTNHRPNTTFPPSRCPNGRQPAPIVTTDTTRPACSVGDVT